MIAFTDVEKSYTVGTKALRGISLQIEDGEFAFLVGPSGSGKSTIIKLITGELKPTGKGVTVRRAEILALQSALDTALDGVRDRFGSAAVTRGVLLRHGEGMEVPLLPD